MARRLRERSSRPGADPGRILEHARCENCADIDLEMLDPLESEEAGEALTEGRCARCGDAISSSPAHETVERGS